jgi:hypothetical protein
MSTFVQVENVIPALLSAGILSTADAVRRQIELVPIGRSHPVFQLMLDGRPVAAIKLFGPRRGDTDGEAAREAAVLDLAKSLPELEHLLPPVLINQVDAGFFVWNWFDGLPAWEGDSLGSALGSGPASDLEALAKRIIGPLAAMHRASARLVHAGTLTPILTGPCPWGLRLFDGDSPAELWQHPAVGSVLTRASVNRLLVTGVRRARGAWRAVALIHADLKHDNVLVNTDGRIALIDWEMARIGDPAWDLAGLMVRPLLSPEAGGWCEANQQVTALLLNRYAAASRLALAPLAQRLILYCGAWLLMTVLQFRSVTADPEEFHTQRILATAAACFEQCDQLVERLIQVEDVA